MSIMSCAFSMNFNIGDFFDRFTRKNSEKKPAKKARVYQPFTTPDGLNIQGPLADHLKAMYTMAEAFEPGTCDRIAKASRLVSAPVQTASSLSSAEMEALANAGNTGGAREPETAKSDSGDDQSAGNEPADDALGDSSKNTENIIAAVREVAEDLDRNAGGFSPANPNPARPDAGTILRPDHSIGKQTGSRRRRRSGHRIPA